MGSGREGEAIGQLLAVTGWVPERAAEHVAVAFEVWEARSRRVWELDLSMLTGAGIAVRRPEPAAERSVTAGRVLRS
jgi:hypothetical protein